MIDEEPSAFGGEFAIPHSMHMDASATAIGVLVTEKPIPWGTSLVRLVLLFALSPDGRFLVAAGERSTTVSLYAVDGDALDLVEQVETGRGANWVRFA